MTFENLIHRILPPGSVRNYEVGCLPKQITGIVTPHLDRIESMVFLWESRILQGCRTKYRTEVNPVSADNLQTVIDQITDHGHKNESEVFVTDIIVTVK